jgi:hypothetical protein
MKRIDARLFALLKGTIGMIVKTTFSALNLIAGISLTFCGWAQAESLSPPPYNIQNRHGVNMASGHVSPKQTDIAIGGSLGLSHTISTFTSNFVNHEGGGSIGFKEKFKGGVYKNLRYAKSDLSGADLWVVTAYDDSSSTDFLINSDGDTFTSRGDKRYTLEFVNKPEFMGYVYTKPDGTAVLYKSAISNHDHRSNQTLGSFGISEIQYPNGLTITITSKSNGQWAPVASVVTNTGFQLKYIYVKKDGYSAPSTYNPGNDELNWSDQMPRYIWAINNAVDYCSTAANDYTLPPAQACLLLSKTWPKVTYEWPTGMPGVMYSGPAVFKVTDATGLITEYGHKPFSSYIPILQPDPNRVFPRLVSIKNPGSSAPAINYDYATTSTGSNVGAEPFNFTNFQSGPIAQLKRSWVGNDSIGYNLGTVSQYGGFSTNSCGGYKGLAVGSHALTGIYKIEAWDKVINLSINPDNRVTSIAKTYGAGGVSATFDYDTRGNMTLRTEDGLSTTAEYLPTCDSNNRKTCNQATWIRDTNGKQTDYTYHPESGQVATVTLPADNNGVRPQTRYTYEARNATYKIDGNTLKQSPKPIWLLSKESKCQTTAATTAGCAVGSNDEVVTVYDYGLTSGANNLLLRGVTVTALTQNGTGQNAMETRRTCFNYDDYGNRIGETKPNAQLASCY